MNPKHNSWKVLKLFTIAVTAAVLSAGLSKVAAEETIGERLAKVREQLKKAGQQMNSESYLQDDLENKEKETLLSQWPNWANFGNWPNWANWPNFGNWPNY